MARGIIDIMIEAVPERKDIKQAVFEELEKRSGEKTILASNTSSISISEISSFVEKGEQVIGLHFFNQPTIMKLVEVIRSPRTDESILTRSKEFILSIDKVPIEVN